MRHKDPQTEIKKTDIFMPKITLASCENRIRLPEKVIGLRASREAGHLFFDPQSAYNVSYPVSVTPLKLYSYVITFSLQKLVFFVAFLPSFVIKSLYRQTHYKLLSRLLTTLCIIFLYTSVPAFAQETPDWDKLVQAVIMVESSGNPNAVSKCGAIGLMQITSIVLKEWNINSLDHPISLHPDHTHCYEYNIGNLYNPILNVKIGTWYLKRLYHYYKCPTIEHILASYNGGITRLRKNDWDINKMPKETRNYVKKVMKLYNN